MEPDGRMTASVNSRVAASYVESVLRGRILDLAHPWQPGMPVSPAHIPYSFTLSRRHGDMPRDDGLCTADEVIVLSGHTGTHLDALGHASKDGKLLGGLNAAEVQTGGRGLTQLGVETIAPIVCRGILLDVAAVHEVSALSPAYEVTVADLEAASELANAWPDKGDAVLIRTGWAEYWSDHGRYLGEGEGLPGPGELGVAWLADRSIRVTGSDTLVYEVVRPGHNRRPGHRRLLVEAGIPIIENLNLEALSQDGATFVFVAAPLALVGATASPIRPLAIYPPRSAKR
jgi:kynurenine formamidase